MERPVLADARARRGAANVTPLGVAIVLTIAVALGTLAVLFT